MKSKNVALKIFLISALFYLTVVDVIYITAYFNDKSDVVFLKNKLETIKRENAELTEKIKNSSTPAFIEKIAREKFMLAKKGETVIYFKVAPKEKNKKVIKESSNFFEKILNKLLHLFQN